MVREKSGNYILGQKSKEFFYFRPKVRVFFTRMGQCRDFHKILMDDLTKKLEVMN